MRDFMLVEYVIRLEDPRQDDVIRMLSALDKYLQSLLSAGKQPHSGNRRAVRAGYAILGRATRKAWRTAAARYGIDAGGYGEVKRMYVTPGRAAGDSGVQSSRGSRTRRRAKALR